MAQLTIAQRRERALNYFNQDYIRDEETARKIINSFYRLSGLSERVCYRQNDERTCNSRYTAELEEKEERWIERLNGYLKPYGLKVIYFGIYPTICKPDTEKSGNCGTPVYESILY